MRNQIHSHPIHPGTIHHPHILWLMDYGKIGKEIWSVQANHRYKLIKVFQNSDPSITEINGKALRIEQNTNFQFWQALVVIDQWENWSDGTVKFIYTWAMNLAIIQSKIRQVVGETFH